MKTVNIAVDIDDTLYSFTDEAREVLSQMIDEYPHFPQLKHALYAKWDQWRTPYELCGEDFDGESLWLQVIGRCHDNDRILAQQPFLGAAEVCRELLDAGHNLTYISNRATETEEATGKWLSDHGFFGKGMFPHDHIGQARLVVTSGDKEPFISDHQYMIDDRPKNVISFVFNPSWHGNAGRPERKAFVRVADYNGGLTDVPGLFLAHTWEGLRRYMVKEELLSPRSELVPA